MTPETTSRIAWNVRAGMVLAGGALTVVGVALLNVPSALVTAGVGLILAARYGALRP